MLHFVLKDVNPNKVNSFEDFLKEMNDLSVLLTVASGPHCSAKQLTNDGKGKYTFVLTENGYESFFNGEKTEAGITAGHFEIKNEGKKIVEVSYTIIVDKAIAIRVWMDCDGEALARTELEKNFKRDFSQEAHGYMKESLENLRKPKLTIDSPELDALLDNKKMKEEEIIEQTVTPKEINEPIQKEEVLESCSTEDVTDEIGELSERTIEIINNKRSLTLVLNNLSHDLTRGRTINFADSRLNTETLENGASVSMLDDSSGDYDITLRIGELDELSEISFFLENETGLIFSVYISSEGKAAITAPAGQEHIVFQKVRSYLF